MGWFSGPDVRERSRAGRTEWYGKCEECKTEHFHIDKKKALRALEDCAKKDKREKERQEAEDLKTRAEKARKQAEDKAAKDRKKEQERAEELKKKLLKGAREKRREAKGKKCPYCGKMPCIQTKPKCAMTLADRFESSMNMDLSDPATFNEQLRFYKDNM